MTKRREKLPKEFWQHLIPMDASLLNDEGPQFIFMTASQLEAERQSIAKAFPAPAGHASLYRPTAEQGFRLAALFDQLLPFAEPPPLDALAECAGLLQRSQSAQIGYRLDQIRRLIWHAERFQGRDFDPTDTFAVSPLWRRRWEMLLSGILLPAYIGHLSVHEMP